MERLLIFKHSQRIFSIIFRQKDGMKKKQRATFYCEVVDVTHAATKREVNLNNQRTERFISHF